MSLKKQNTTRINKTKKTKDNRSVFLIPQKRRCFIVFRVLISLLMRRN